MNQSTPFEHNPLQAQEPQSGPACAYPDTPTSEVVAADEAVLVAVVSQAVMPNADQAPVVLPTTLNAAQDAAAFVARMFAEVSAPDGADTAPADLSETTQASQEAAPEFSAVPADWPVSYPAATDVQPGNSKFSRLQGQRVLVLGLGASGLAMARWCVRCGAHVTVADTRDAPPQLVALQQTLPQVQFVSGPMTADVLGADIQAVYRSPGLSPESIAPVLDAATARGVVVSGELGLYAAALADLRAAHGYAPAVLAITGTNGKTTVTSLTGQLVERSGKTVAVAGNIGPTLLDTLAAHIDATKLPQVWVLELSSFQLDGVNDFEPTAATVLNVTQDHLDWHGDINAYAAAKARIFGAQSLMLLNRDDELVMQMLPPPVRLKLQKPQQREHVTFGADMPRRPGDYGIEIVNGMAWLVRAAEADETRKRSRNNVMEEDLYIQRLMPADALRIRGRHNAVNALSALALACAGGCPLAPMLYGLREYRGEPHRVEPVATVADVEYFDDSKGTNVGATVAALTGLGADRRIVVILGGEGKGQDFSPLAAPVSRYARAVVLIGRDASLIQAALEGTGVAMLQAADLPQAVRTATQRAHAGDAVLLSPACASFDMFTGYEHRARVFCETVYALAEEVGQTAGGLA